VDPSRPSLYASPCTIRQVRSSVPSAECQGCGKQAPRAWDVTRVAIDIDLDQPVVLAVEVSVHHCQACHRLFRAQPPFLRPGATYTRRVVQKAIEAVYCDGMAARDVPDRLARDFWVRPAEKMVRLWCRAFADHLDFETDYQPWVIASFSGVLCVDELYQGEVALLLAVDPAAAEGDRLVGYMLVSKGVDATAVKTFLGRLKSLGIEPAEVITDDSALYPAVLAQIWPAAAHQLCLFHATRHVVEAVNAVIKRVRKALPVPPPTTAPSLHGRLRQIPLDPDQHDLTAERYRWREARRTTGIAQVHALRRQGFSERALARQLGVNRRTIHRWLKLPPPDQARVASVTEAVVRVVVASSEPPPAPWRDWDQVRRVREALRQHRTLLLRRPDHLSAEEHQIVTELLRSPAGASLRVARTFLEAWFAIWYDEAGQRRAPADAEDRYRAWHDDAEAAALTPLRRQQQYLDADHFNRLSVFLHNSAWEPTNNAAERAGRGFRHRQHPHFRLRTLAAINADLKVHACLRKQRICSPPPLRLHACQRGRSQHTSHSSRILA
jgi:transposase